MPDAQMPVPPGQPIPSESSSPAPMPVPRQRQSVLFRHRWNLVWALAVVLVVWLQWPMLKGIYYRSTGEPPPGSAVPWRSGYDAALAEAAQSGKPVLIDFSATWCPPCQVMAREVWPDAQVGKLAAARFVPVAVDVDAHPELARRYGINMIPTVVVTDASGRELRRSGYLTREQMIEFLQEPEAARGFEGSALAGAAAQ